MILARMAHHDSAQLAAPPLSRRNAVGFIVVAAASFHLAFANPALAVFVAVYLGALVELTRIESSRGAFYAGLALGLLVFVPKLVFFFTLFDAAAIALWMILALWHGLFVYLGSWARKRFSRKTALILIPIFWTGLEYFRSELYPLKFSWMAPGYAFSLQPTILISTLGLYGTSFAIILLAALMQRLPTKLRILASAGGLIVLFGVAQIPPSKAARTFRVVDVAGLQLEFPVELEVPGKLDALNQKYPTAELFILSEYTFDGPIPKPVARWCKQNQKYLIVGAKEPTANGNFYNTAFVIGPEGEVVFKQVKAVPIQFFKDGLPAPEQRLWDSPWGKIGLCVCYDLSYTRVTDALVKQGAEALIVPTMDVADWGPTQHELHAMIAPMRATEYGIPIFRLASSGISQMVAAGGNVLSTASFPGQGESLQARLQFSANARRPLDRFFAPGCSAVSILGLVGACFSRRSRVSL